MGPQEMSPVVIHSGAVLGGVFYRSADVPSGHVPVVVPSGA